MQTGLKEHDYLLHTGKLYGSQFDFCLIKPSNSGSC